MNAAISVIIPIYNGHKFILRCLGSLQSQTFGLWEAICVNDGSTDTSARLLDELAASDPRIKVIHKENEGVSVARNTALAMVSTELVTFVDCDDFLHPQTFEICMDLVRKENPDMIAYTYDRAYRRNVFLRHLLHIPETTKKHFRRYDIREIRYRATDDIYRYATEYSHPRLSEYDRRWAVKHCQPWRCMYRTENIKTIRFQSGIIYEDFPWWGEVLLNIHKTVIINLPLYFYYPNRWSSILSSNQLFKIESLKKAIEISENTYRQKADDYQREKWNQNFIVPFKAKMESKIKKYGS